MLQSGKLAAVLLALTDLKITKRGANLLPPFEFGLNKKILREENIG